MGLTSTPFLATAMILTLAAAALLIWHWRRLARTGARFVIMRTAALGLVNVLVLVTAAIYLNHTYLFFASWQDMNAVLSGTVSGSTIAKGGTTQEVFKGHVQGNHATPTATLLPLPGGFDKNGIGHFLVHGPVSNLTGVIDVRKPRGQDPSQSPVLMTFAGYPADPSQWLNSMKVGPAIDKQVQSKALRSPLVVSPQTQFPQGVDTECVNGRPTDPAVETWLSTDVPNWIVSHFSVDTNRNAWATIGLSEGGYCAAMVAMHHPSQFGGAVVLGGYFRPEFGHNYRPFTSTSRMGMKYDLITQAELRPPPVAMWLQTSLADPLSYGTSGPFLKAARAPLSVHAMVLRHSGHSMLLWQEVLPTALKWLGTSLSGFH